MELRIYDSTLKRKGVVENHSSLIWTRKYFEPGDFELHVPLTDENISLLPKGSIITKDNTVEAGIIESIVYTDNYDQKDIVVSGRFLSSLFDRRLVKNTFSWNSLVETGMRSLVSSVEAIPLLELGTLQGFVETVTFQVTMKELLATLTKLSKSSGIGYRVKPVFTSREMLFECYKGVDRSVDQHVNNRVIFSDVFNNLEQVQYTWNDQLLKTYAIVGGEGEGPLRVYVTVGSGSGLGLREVFVDARDVRSDDFTTTEEYEDALKQRGYDVLKKDIEVESFDYSVIPDTTFEYKTDYDLGDIITISKSDWGVTLNSRITEVQEVYENGGMTVALTLGDALPDTVDWSD